MQIDRMVEAFRKHLEDNNIDPDSIEIFHSTTLYTMQGKDHVITEKFTYKPEPIKEEKDTDVSTRD